jgi:GTPase SAR1 family protein
MDITMIGLQNAGKTSLLRVLAVSLFLMRKQPLSSRSTSVPSCASRRRRCFIRVPKLLLCATMNAIVAGPSADWS